MTLLMTTTECLIETILPYPSVGRAIRNDREDALLRRAREVRRHPAVEGKGGENERDRN